ncbi:MAG: transposase, partial [Candidatus Lambdaproteobacteria bacterium RIFOXYD2_FULL_56_26]
MLVDGRGVPLSIVVTGANTHDVTQLEAVLASVVIKRPKCIQRLCADKGYFGKLANWIIRYWGYQPKVVPRGEEAKQKRRGEKKKARRWVVEVVHAWLNRFRKLLVRYEKKACNYL